MREEPLPYFNERETPIDMIVLHCSAYDVETIIHYMHEYQLSAHYIINEKGEMTKLVDESKRAYHAGTGFWRGEDRSPNARSIGIELVNFSLGQETYAPQQIDTLLNFLPPLIGKYNIRPEMIVGHSDIAPLRKADPGRAFPWERLANAGIGLWYQLSNAEKIPSDDLEELLRLIGYDTRTPQTVYASACPKTLTLLITPNSDKPSKPSLIPIQGTKKVIRYIEIIVLMASLPNNSPALNKNKGDN